MTKGSFSVQVTKNLIPKVRKETAGNVRKAVREIGRDLSRTASETAPHNKGVLEKSYTVKYSTSQTEISATVRFSVTNNGFNYAVQMHEGFYNLGTNSKGKPGGVGMSGTKYPVGRQFLTRVAQGEQSTYRNHILKAIVRMWRG